MELNIPVKKNGLEDKNFNHQCRLSADKTIKLARCREVLGGYSTQELLEILIDKLIEEYYDGKEPNKKLLPGNLKE